MSGGRRGGDAPDRQPAHRRRLAILWLAFLGFGAAYVAVAPLGEAPDAPAHLGYVAYLLEHDRLPPRTVLTGHDDYEAHQPPLDYVLSASLYRALGGEAGDWRFTPRDDFRFDQPGSRNVDLVLPRPEAGPRLLGLRIVRFVVWGGGTLLAVLLLVESVAGGSPIALAAVISVMFAPQVLFVFASVGNDPAVACLAAWSLLGLVFLLRGSADGPADVATGLVAGVALFAKSSAVALLLPVAVTAGLLWHRRRRAPAVWLLTGWLLPAVGWLAMNAARFACLWPPPPTGVGPAEVERLLELRWIGSLFVSFWAKLGWLNLPLPAPLYLLFLPATLAITAGFWLAASDLRRRRTALLPVLLLPPVNLALLIVYMAKVDWQPQGRLLAPSLAALGTLSAMGAEHVSGRLSAWSRSVLGPLLIALAMLAAAFGAWWLDLHYPS